MNLGFGVRANRRASDLSALVRGMRPIWTDPQLLDMPHGLFCYYIRVCWFSMPNLLPWTLLPREIKYIIKVLYIVLASSVKLLGKTGSNHILWDVR